MNEKKKKEINNITTELFVNEFEEMESSRKIFNNILIDNDIEIYGYNEYCVLFKKTIDHLILNNGITNTFSTNDLLHEMYKNAYVEKIILKK